MRRQTLIAFAAFVALSACDRGKLGETVADTPQATAPAVAATSFMTENMPPPPGAVDSRGDGVMRDADGRPFGYALLGRALPAFAAPMADGTTFDSENISRWTVIYVWGAWCGDCLADGPYADALARAVAQDPDLDFVSIHVPASKARATPEELYGKFGSLEAYFASAGYTLPTVVDPDGRLRQLLEISWTPSYLLIGPDRVVQGFRSDLSKAGGEPVKDFLREVAGVRKQAARRALPTIGPDGAMQLSGPTVFDVRAVEAAFPGHEVVPVTDSATKTSVFHVRARGETSPRFIIASDWTRGYVGKVTAVDPSVTGPDGMVIGRTQLQAMPAALQTRCEPYSTGDTSEGHCESADGRFTLVFRPDNAGVLVLAEMSFLPPVPGE